MTPLPTPDNQNGAGRNTSLDRAPALICQSQKVRAGNDPASLIAVAPRTRCLNNPGLFILSAQKGLAFHLTCGRWDCPAPSCGGLKRLGALEVLRGGILDAWERGQIVRAMTFTAPAGGMSFEEMKVGWNRVRANLRYRGVLNGYAAVVELQERGAPHLHILTTGEFIAQEELVKVAQGRPGSRGRFGKVTDIRKVRGTGPRSFVGYLLKEVGGKEVEDQKAARYLAKAQPEDFARLKRISGGRTRPLRIGGDWYPGGQKAAREAVKAQWSDGAPPIHADDWAMWRIDLKTGEPKPLRSATGLVLPASGLTVPTLTVAESPVLLAA